MTARILLIDNYDSFTYNLVQAFLIAGASVDVRMNDEICAATGLSTQPTHLVISPGPGAPSQAGVSMGLIDAMMGRVPILGVCLGHQAIVEVLGGRVIRADAPTHGKSSVVSHDGSALYRSLPSRIEVGRYHSLAAERSTLPGQLIVASETDSGEIMGVRHQSLPVFGVQFHPESVLTPLGSVILRNFIDAIAIERAS